MPVAPAVDGATSPTVSAATAAAPLSLPIIRIMLTPPRVQERSASAYPHLTSGVNCVTPAQGPAFEAYDETAIAGVQHQGFLVPKALSMPVRQAVTFIDEHLEEPMGLAGTAAAARMSPRRLQAAFRRERDTTPLGYLRTVRLEAGHRELMAVDPIGGGERGCYRGPVGFRPPLGLMRRHAQPLAVRPIRTAVRRVIQRSRNHNHVMITATGTTTMAITDSKSMPALVPKMNPSNPASTMPTSTSAIARSWSPKVSASSRFPRMLLRLRLFPGTWQRSRHPFGGIASCA